MNAVGVFCGSVVALTSLGFVSSAIAQEGEIIVSFDKEVAAPQLDEEQLERLSDLGLSSADVVGLAEIAREYQAERNEGLGVELDLDRGRFPDLRLRSDLMPGEISITPEFLNAYATESLARQSGQDREALLESVGGGLSDNLEGIGAFEAATLVVPRKTGTDQTVDPTDPGLTDEERERLEEFCRLNPDHCVQPESILSQVTPVTSQSGFLNMVSASVFGGPAAVSTSVSAPQRPEELNRFKVNLPPILAWLKSISAPPEDLRECADARSAFNEIVERNKQAFQKLDTSWTRISGAKQAARRFDKACLAGPEELPDYVAQRLAVVKVGDNPLPECTAFQISPTKFLTAKHCFHDQETGLPNWSALTDSLVFRYADPGKAIAIEPVKRKEIPRTKPGQELSSHSDFIVLNTVDPVEGGGQVSIAPAVLGNEVLIPGYFHFARTSSGSISQSSWRDSMRLTKSVGGGYCRVFDVSARDETGCLVHLCQAIPGFSGSPVLQSVPNGAFTLVGLHVRADGNRKRNCPTPFLIGNDRPIVDHGNLAVVISDARVGRE